MRKSYITCNRFVNPIFENETAELAVVDPEGVSILTRLHRAYDFEGLRPLLERCYSQTMAKRKQEKVLKAFETNLSRQAALFEIKPNLEMLETQRLAPLKSTGRPRFDVVTMFKICLTADCFGYSHETAALELRTSKLWQIFCCVSPDASPSRETIWHYHEIFTESNTFELAAHIHIQELREEGLIQPDEDIALDGSFVESPIQHFTKFEKSEIEAGRGDQLWQDQPAKKRQKDVDCRWGKKGVKSFHGFKQHVLATLGHKFILHVETTPANTNDNQVVDLMVCEEDRGRRFFADAGYAGQPVMDTLNRFGIIGLICAKGYRNKPLTDEQKISHRAISRLRSRIEHIFGYIEGSMRGPFFRRKGMDRAINYNWTLVVDYNLLRAECVRRTATTP